MVDKTDEEMAELVDTLDLPIEETTTYEKWQKGLVEELGDRYSETLAGKSWRGVETKYVALPELGLRMERTVRYPGTIKQYTQLQFRDVETGRYVSPERSTAIISDWWKLK